MALRHIGVCVAFCISGGRASPLPFNISLEGSADEEDFSSFASSLPTTALFDQNQTTAAGPTHVDTDFLSQVVNFLEENMLFILVAAVFVLLFLVIIGREMFLIRKRKDNAYYPSSFPSSMYVDHRDKTGGAKLFNEVPEKAAPEPESEPVDSHKQLRADIARAAKRLRTPNKCDDAAKGSGDRDAGHRQEDGSEARGGLLEQQLQNFPEEKEPSEHSDSGEAAAGGGTEPSPAEHLRPDNSGEPLIGRSLRPSSLHIHHDSATLQLIAGEKTAF